jgi:tetratricopeptide (TPR) repeat protein
MADQSRLEELRRRVEKDPSSIAFAQLAEEYRRAGRFREAVDTCRAGLAIHPGYLSARVTLGRALMKLDRLDEAQAELERVRQSAPENLAAIRGLAEIHHHRGSLGEALDQYRRALSLARNDPELERTVSALSREVKSTGPSPAGDPLVSQPAPRVMVPEAPPKPIPTVMTRFRDEAAAFRATRTIAALEQWLAAIHVARAERAT